MDLANILTSQTHLKIEKICQDFWNSKKAQIQVLIIPTLDETPIEQAAIKIVEKWKLGTEKEDNGVLLIVALKERKIRIEVGQGLEGHIPDVVAKRIISDQIVPFFRKNNFSDGILVGVLLIARSIDPNYNIAIEVGQTNRHFSKNKRYSLGDSALIIILFVLFGFLSLFSRGRGGIWRGGRGSSWGGGGFGGGGGWSGGGGGFSGGGSSGDW